MSESKVYQQKSKSIFLTDASPLPDPLLFSLSVDNANVPRSQTDAAMDIAMSPANPVCNSMDVAVANECGRRGQPRQVVGPFTKPRSLFADQ